MIGVRHRNGRVIHGVGLQRAWVPWRDPSCLCAFDADPGNYVKNGSGVSRWNDLTGHGYHALQPTALNQPTWTESDSDFRGHGSLLFNGTSSFLYVSTIPIPSKMTWYAVAKWGTNSNTKTIIDSYNTPGYRQTIYANGSGRVSCYAGVVLAGGGDVRGQLCVISYVANGASSVLRSNAMSPIATGNAGSLPMPSLCIGAYTVDSNMMEGKIVAIYGFTGTHTDAISSRILHHLGSKYGRSIAA